MSPEGLSGRLHSDPPSGGGIIDQTFSDPLFEKHLPEAHLGSGNHSLTFVIHP